MRRIVETAILRLPSKIKGMRMREFMTDYGGDAALVLEKDRKQSRCVDQCIPAGKSSIGARM